MESRNESKKIPDPRAKEKKPRFQIPKLEERIAPCGGWYRYHGHKIHFHYRGPCGGK